MTDHVVRTNREIVRFAARRLGHQQDECCGVRRRVTTVPCVDIARTAKGIAMKPEKILYKPVGVVGGIVAGAIASAVFKRTWKLIEHESEPPRPRDEDRHWTEILLAAAIQGAIFAAVKAAVDRGGATAMRRATGAWPG